MATGNGNETKPNVTLNRRDLLKVGAAVAGTALLPTRAGAGSGDDYRATITRVAEELRPCFESGELHGFRDNDDDLQDEVWCEQHGVLHDPDYRDSLWVLEDILGNKVLGFQPEHFGDWEEKPARRAAWVLTHSPSTPHVMDSSGETLFGMATHALAYDVLRIARQRGWYVATSDECPSNADLGLDGLATKEAAPAKRPLDASEPDPVSGAERIARRLDHDTGKLWAAVEETRRASMGVDRALAGVGASTSAHDVKKAAHELHMASGRLWEAASHVIEDKAAMA